MNLQLSNGVAIVGADRKLIRFMENEYAIYDGVHVLQDSTLTMLDVLLSVAMNSRLDTADKIRSVWNGRSLVEVALAAVPIDIALQDDQIPWQSLEVLFSHFCGVKYVGPAVATKILHKKRPRLIPVWDSVISEFIGACNDGLRLGSDSTGAAMVYGIRCFRNVLVQSLDQIEALLALPEMRAFPVTPVRALEVLLWIENEGNGYYQSCPACRCEHAIPIVYENPTAAQQKLERQGRVVIDRAGRASGGPKWVCPECGSKWGAWRFPVASPVAELVRADERHRMNSDLFYFYENWVAKGHTATIHRASCGFCNDGRGVHKGSSNSNGAWSASPFGCIEEARRAAEATGATVGTCSFCLKTCG